MSTVKFSVSFAKKTHDLVVKRAKRRSADHQAEASHLPPSKRRRVRSKPNKSKYLADLVEADRHSSI